jgi:hypothetical protein
MPIKMAEAFAPAMRVYFDVSDLEIQPKCQLDNAGIIYH